LFAVSLFTFTSVSLLRSRSLHLAFFCSFVNYRIASAHRVICLRAHVSALSPATVSQRCQCGVCSAHRVSDSSAPPTPTITTAHARRAVVRGRGDATRYSPSTRRSNTGMRYALQTTLAHALIGARPILPHSITQELTGTPSRQHSLTLAHKLSLALQTLYLTHKRALSWTRSLCWIMLGVCNAARMLTRFNT
jgi:hypothetical protein